MISKLPLNTGSSADAGDGMPVRSAFWTVDFNFETIFLEHSGLVNSFSDLSGMVAQNTLQIQNIIESGVGGGSGVSYSEFNELSGTVAQNSQTVQAILDSGFYGSGGLPDFAWRINGGFMQLYNYTRSGFHSVWMEGASGQEFINFGPLEI